MDAINPAVELLLQRVISHANLLANTVPSIQSNPRLELHFPAFLQYDHSLDSSRVVLITCGGAFDDNVLGYDDNIAVTAVAAAA